MAGTELKQLLLRYIDGFKGIDRLREVLQTTSVDDRYEVLRIVRGRGQWSAVHKGAARNDVESIKYMMDGFTSDQHYNIVSVQDRVSRTALHETAYNHNDTSVAMYLLGNLSVQQRYNILRIQDYVGNTPLHYAATNKHTNILQVMLSSVTPDQQKLLLNFKNEFNKTIADKTPLPKLPYDVAAWTALELDVTKQKLVADVTELREDNTNLAHKLKSQNAELISNREVLHSTRVELHSTREELHSTREGLHSTREELHSTREELHTQAAELQQLRDNQTEMLRMISDLQISLGMCFSTGDTPDQENEN